MNAAGLHYFPDIIACEVVVVLGFVCVNLRNQRETLGFLLCRLIEYSYVNILPQITQMTQRECSRAALFRRERQFVRLMWLLGFVCDHQRDLRETYWGFFVQIY